MMQVSSELKNGNNPLLKFAKNSVWYKENWNISLQFAKNTIFCWRLLLALTPSAQVWTSYTQWAVKGGHNIIGNTRALQTQMRCFLGVNGVKTMFETLFRVLKPLGKFFWGVFARSEIGKIWGQGHLDWVIKSIFHAEST